MLMLMNWKKEAIEQTGRFFITAETIDPYHIISDIF